MKATVHVGPKGGTEYRLWTGEATYRVVSKYQAKNHLSPDEAQKASAMDEARKQAARDRANNEATWRAIASGRGVLA